jgi:hypothetical protein
MAADDGIAQLFDERTLSIIRVAAINGERRTVLRIEHGSDYLSTMNEAAFGRVQSQRVLNFYVSDWYIFAEYLLTVEVADTKVTRRMAAVYPVTAEGRLVGQLAYALDVVTG